MTRTRALALTITAVLAVLFGGLTATAASAHTPRASATCDALTVTLTDYNGANTVTVSVDDVALVDAAPFGNSYAHTFPLEPGTAHAWKVKVRAHDDPDGSRQWSVNLTGTTTPCIPAQPEPRVEVVTWSDSACVLPNDGTIRTTTYAHDVTYPTAWDGSAWVEGDGVIGDDYEVDTTVADAQECAVVEPTPTPTPTETAPVVIPTADPPVTTTPTVEPVVEVGTVARTAAPALAATGASTGLGILVALILVVAGVTLVAIRRRS